MVKLDILNIYPFIKAPSQEYRVEGLEESQEYEARVRTRTRAGLSPYSQVLQFGAVTHYSQPTKLSMSRLPFF